MRALTHGWSVSARIGHGTGPRRPDGCRDWLWSISKSTGYPQLELREHGRKRYIVSRLILGLAKGDPRVAMHTCDRPSCVEPSHLRIGTLLENNRDMIEKGRNHYRRRTHCPAGHPYDAVNTMLRANGHRVCRTCNNVRSGAAHKAKRESRAA